MQEVHRLLKEGDKRKYHDFSNWAVTRLGLRPTKDVGDGGLDGVGHVTLWNPQQMKETNARILPNKTGKPPSRNPRLLPSWYTRSTGVSTRDMRSVNESSLA